MTSSLARRPTTAERVLTLLAEQAGESGLTRAEIKQRLSVPLGTVDRAVLALVERGAVRQLGATVPAHYAPTGGAFTPRGHLASAPAPTDVDAPIIARHLTYLRTRNLASAYIDQRRRALLNLAAWAGRPLLDLSPADLERWQSTALPGRNSGRSRNTLTSHIRGFYTWCHLVEEITADDRGRKLVHAKVGRLLPRPIGRAALVRALADAPPRVRPMLYLAAYQGLRAVEIAGLRRENVHDLDEPPHLVVLGKGNKERVLPLQPRVLAELQAYGLPRRGPVFTMYDNAGRRTSRPITPARVSAACGTYLADAGTGATLHALRHFFATALYQTSQDLRLVQEALGHSSPNITAIYAAFDTSKTAGAMAQVAAVIEVP